MILDALVNWERYTRIDEKIACALTFLTSPEAARLEPATSDGASTRFDIRGDEIFALVQRYRTREPSEAFWEAHRRHIDVQCVCQGTEDMGWLPLEATRVVKPYDETKDFSVHEQCPNVDANYVRVTTGMFAIFFPHDAHMPGLATNAGVDWVTKIVVKVRV